MSRQPHRRRRLRWLPRLLGLLAVLLVAVVALTAYQALQTRTALVEVGERFQRVASLVQAGDVAAASAELDATRDSARRAAEATDGPNWAAAASLPWVGDDVHAVRTVADIADQLAGGVLPDVVVAARGLDADSLRPRDGRIDLAPLQEAGPAVVEADEALQLQARRAADLETGGLLSPVAEPVEQLQQKLAEVADVSSAASYAVRLLPPMLGADGPRTYLVLFQNNAEMRSTGGIPGALALVRAEGGRIEILRQGTAAELGSSARPVVPLDPVEVGLFTDKIATFGQNVTLTPDFPRAAQIARTMWESRQGGELDGVLAADPVALANVLRGTGPVDVPGGGQLTAENAVDLLLNEVYLRVEDARAQDEYYAAAARAVFDALVSGRGSGQSVLGGLSASASEGRLLAWSRRPAEQELIEQTVLAGRLDEDPSASPAVGVFLNEAGASKMAYYLRHRVDVDPVACDGSGRQRLVVRVTLQSEAPKDGAGLPPLMLGRGPALGIRDGDLRLNVLVYAPAGGMVEEVSVDATSAAPGTVEHLGRPVVVQTVDVAPGGTRTVEVTVLGGLAQRAEPRLRVTPGAKSSGIGEVGPSACS